MYHYAIPLLEKNPDYIILYIGTNDASYKTGLDISNEIMELICTDNYNANNENGSFVNSLKESDVLHITHDNIIKKHLYRDGYI